MGNATESVIPGNCFHDNTDTSGTVTSDPPDIQTVDGTCGGPAPGDPTLVAEIVCASGIQQSSGLPPCPDNPPTHYPQTTKVKMLPMPPQATPKQAFKFAEALVRGQPDRGAIISTVFEDKIKELV